MLRLASEAARSSTPTWSTGPHAAQQAAERLVARRAQVAVGSSLGGRGGGHGHGIVPLVPGQAHRRSGASLLGVMDFMPLGGLWLLFVLVLQFGVIVLVVLGIVWLVRHLGAGSTGPSLGPNRSALDELEMRYARGEIDRSTYLQMQDDLKRRAPG